MILEDIFTEIYEKGILLFLDTSTYLKNTIDDVMVFERSNFLKIFKDQIKVGYIYILTGYEDIMDQMDHDSNAIINYGFNSDTNEKSDETGRIFIQVLISHNLLPKCIDIEYTLKQKYVPLVLSKAMVNDELLDHKELLSMTA